MISDLTIIKSLSSDYYLYSIISCVNAGVLTGQRFVLKNKSSEYKYLNSFGSKGVICTATLIPTNEYVKTIKYFISDSNLITGSFIQLSDGKVK